MRQVEHGPDHIDGGAVFIGRSIDVVEGIETLRVSGPESRILPRFIPTIDTAREKDFPGDEGTRQIAILVVGPGIQLKNLPQERHFRKKLMKAGDEPVT